MLQFGPFTLDRANRELRRDGDAVELGSRYFDALSLLVQHAGELVTKDRFMEQVWRGIPVTDEALTQCIRTLRRALGDEAARPEFIETVPKHGYRFVARVEASTHGASTRGGESMRSGRIAGASTVAGGLAGALGGLFYGFAGSDGAALSILALVALGTALGTLAGAGVGSGFGAGVAWMGPRASAFLIGGTLGGAVTGGLGELLVHGGIVALTGNSLSAITGLMEGTILGIASGMAGAAASTRRAAMALASGLALGALAGVAIAFAGGRMLGLSLLAFENRFPASRLDIQRVGETFGENGFYKYTILGSTVLECAVFVAAMALAVRWSGRSL